MKPVLLFLFYMTCMGIPMFPQIVIDQTDMPGPGDTLRVSTTNVVPAGFENTAMDTSWNFAALEALS